MIRCRRAPAQPQFLGMVPERSVGEPEHLGSLLLVATGQVQCLSQEIRAEAVEVFFQVDSLFRQDMSSVGRGVDGAVKVFGQHAGRNEFPCFQGDSSFNDIFQFSDIAGPGMGSQEPNGILRKPLLWYPESLTTSLHEEARKLGQIFQAVSQWWQMDNDDVKTIEEVFPKISLTNLLGQIPVGGSEDPGVDFDFAMAPNRTDTSFLQDAEEFDLHGGRHFADFVQEDGAVFCLSYQSNVIFDSSGERALDVPEQFRFQKVLRHGAAIDAQEWSGCDR